MFDFCSGSTEVEGLGGLWNCGKVGGFDKNEKMWGKKRAKGGSFLPP